MLLFEESDKMISIPLFFTAAKTVLAVPISTPKQLSLKWTYLRQNLYPFEHVSRKRNLCLNLLGIIC